MITCAVCCEDLSADAPGRHLAGCPVETRPDLVNILRYQPPEMIDLIRAHHFPWLAKKPRPLPSARIVGRSRLRALWRWVAFVLGMIGAALLTGLLFVALMAVAVFVCVIFLAVMT
jgi:hypothetical protein